LRRAIEVRREAFDALTKATAAAKRAAELLAGAEHRLHRFAGLEREMENATASRIATWAEQGGEQPSLDPDAKFDEDRRARAEAEQHAAAARTASSSLTAALADAKETFPGADAKVRASATAVLVQEAEPLAAKLMHARNQVWQLEELISALAAAWLPNAPGMVRPVPLPQHILDALHMERPWRAAGSNPVAAWNTLRAALSGGVAEAKLDVP
jgi:hypothetical protein